MHMALDFASIGLRVRHARSQRNLTQEQLADLLGITRKYVSLIETGERNIGLELLITISNTLQVPITELLADQLTGPENITDTDLHYILLDCNQQEERILTKTAQALKAILLEHGI